MNPWICYVFLLDLLILNNSVIPGHSRKHRSDDKNGDDRDSSWILYRRKDKKVVYNNALDLEGNEVEGQVPGSSVDFVWYTQTVAAGDTAVLHCSFDAIFSQLRNGNIDWARVKSSKDTNQQPLGIAEGKKVLIEDRRYRVYRPHNSALSVLIIRRAKKRDAGIYRCNLSGSSTRHKFMALNVTESKIEAHTSPPKLRTRIGKDLTMWCNATGYPNPVVYWTREDHNRKLQDGSYQYWGNALSLHNPTEDDTGVYACYLDNFVQPVVSYTFSISVEDYPWSVDGYKMRFDSTQWYPAASPDPVPVRGMSYLLMCETRGAPKPLPKIKWLRDGRPITNTKHFYIIEDRPDWRTGYTSSTLVIMRFVPRFKANYTCVGTNVFREKIQTFYINHYLDKPESTPPPDLLSTRGPVDVASILDQSPVKNRNRPIIDDIDTETDDDDDDAYENGSAMGDDITDDTEDDDDDENDELDDVLAQIDASEDAEDFIEGSAGRKDDDDYEETG